MGTSIKYEDRGQLYESLVKDLNLTKVEEVYYSNCFGKYFVTFSAGEFLIRYSNDRSQLFICVASNFAPSKWHDLRTDLNHGNLIMVQTNALAMEVDTVRWLTDNACAV
jgi:hypothetical protein